MLETILSAQDTRGHTTAEPAMPAIPAGRPADCYELFLENVVLPYRIGVFDHERGEPQRVRIDLLLQVRRQCAPFSDDIGDVLSYDDLLTGLKRLMTDEHTALVEVLAEKIARMCLSHQQVQSVRVAVAKLDVYDGIAVPGIRLERGREHHRAASKHPLLNAGQRA